jgi:hypothetical protein
LGIVTEKFSSDFYGRGWQGGMAINKRAFNIEANGDLSCTGA